jgi:hypothetical protein
MIRRLQRLPASGAALNWEWFRDRIDEAAREILNADETTIGDGIVVRTSFADGSLLKASGDFWYVDKDLTGAVGHAKADPALPLSFYKPDVPSNTSMRFLGVKLDCRRATVATIAYRSMTLLPTLEPTYSMAYVGTSHHMGLSAFAQNDMAAINGTDDHKSVLSGYHTVDLLEGANYVAIGVLYGNVAPARPQIISVEASIVEIR